jgi:alkylation response protein AidB-like acyl-CoA dehydrogenase
MNFEYTEDQLIIRDSAKKFAEEEIKKNVKERDQKSLFPKEIIKELGELGYLGMLIPEEEGGSGFDSVSYSLVMEEFSKVDASVGVICSVTNSLAAYSLYKFGTKKQKEKYLRPLAEGQYLGAFALTEANAGSDAASLKCSAKEDGDDFILNGEKMWITSAQNADVFIVFARTEPEIKGAKGVTAFILEKELEGFSVDKKEDKMGLRGSHTCPISFTNVKISKENILGERGKGFSVAMSLLDGGRIGIASQALGIAQASLESSIKYAKEREQFGTEIASFQAIQFKIAKMATKIQAARLLTHKAATLRDSGQNVGSIASMAKFMASETAVWCAEQAIQIHGGYGYTKEYDVERYFRDAKVTEIYEGTSQVQQIVIARDYIK